MIAVFPGTYSTLLSIVLVSLFFHRSGLPDGLALAPIMADVHAKDGIIAQAMKQSRRKGRLFIDFTFNFTKLIKLFKTRIQL